MEREEGTEANPKGRCGDPSPTDGAIRILISVCVCMQSLTPDGVVPLLAFLIRRPRVPSASDRADIYLPRTDDRFTTLPPAEDHAGSTQTPVLQSVQSTWRERDHCSPASSSLLRTSSLTVLRAPSPAAAQHEAVSGRRVDRPRRAAQSPRHRAGSVVVELGRSGASWFLKSTHSVQISPN